MAQLIGIKTIINEFAAYQKLGEWTEQCREADGSWKDPCIISFRSQNIASFGKLNWQFLNYYDVFEHHKNQHTNLFKCFTWYNDQFQPFVVLPIRDQSEFNWGVWVHWLPREKKILLKSYSEPFLLECWQHAWMHVWQAHLYQRYKNYLKIVNVPIGTSSTTYCLFQ